MPHGDERMRVLILCTGNSCRSQMAEGFVNHLLSGEWEARSAGTKPANRVHPLAVTAMAEAGIDISAGVPETEGVTLGDPVTVDADGGVLRLPAASLPAGCTVTHNLPKLYRIECSAEDVPGVRRSFAELWGRTVLSKFRKHGEVQ